MTAILDINEVPNPESYALLVTYKCTMTKYCVKVKAYADKYH